MTLDLTVNFGIYRFRREKDTQFWCQYSVRFGQCCVRVRIKARAGC